MLLIQLIKQISKDLLKKEKRSKKLNAFRGVERIRTAVDGVADHCLAARPRHPMWANLQKNLEPTKYLSLSL